MASSLRRSAFPLRLDAGTLPWWLGIVGGLVLPLVAAALFSSYTPLIKPDAVENARHFGFVYLAGEIALILFARRRGLDLGAIWRGMPGWARASAAVFLSTFWISSVFVSLMPSCSAMLTIGWVIHFLFAASVFHLFRTVPLTEAPAIWPGFALGLLGLAIVTFVHFVFLPPALVGLEYETEWSRLVPGFISSRHLGSWAAAVLALVTGYAWIQREGGRGQRGLFLAVALAFGLTFWTGTRAAALAWIVILPIAWVVAGKPRARATLTLLPLYLLAAALVATLLQPYGDPNFSLWQHGHAGSADALSSGRITLWRMSLEVWTHYPLLGTGAGSSWWIVHLGEGLAQPHNALVQFLLNWGLIPTIPAVVLLGGATWHAHRAARREARLLPFVLMLDCLLLMSALEGMLHFAQFVLLIFGCLAICLAKLRAEPA